MHATTDALWGDIFLDAFGIFLGGGTLFVLILVTGWWLVARRLPPADSKLKFSHGPGQTSFTTEQLRRAKASEAANIIDEALIEKVIVR